MTQSQSWPALCIYAGEDGTSHLVDLDLPTTRKVVGEDGTTRWEGIASASTFGLAGGGQSPTYSEWHTCGQAGLSITLRGNWEIEAGDGTRRALGPGDLLVMLDTTGQGHRSWPLGDSPSMVMGLGFGEGVEATMRERLDGALRRRAGVSNANGR